MKVSHTRGSQGGSQSQLASLLVAAVSTLFIASRLWLNSREIVHLRTELAAVQQGVGTPSLQQLPLPGGGGGSLASGLEVGTVSRDGAEEQQPVLFYSVRSAAGSEEPPPLSGARLEDDPVPARWDPQSRLAGQVSLVEAGRVHGWACLKGTLGADLAVSVYVDGVEVGRATAVLPTQGDAVNRLCQIEGLLAAQQAQQAGADQPPQPALEARTGVGFVVPLPPLEQGVHALRAFVTAPGGAYKQELGQSPLLFRESSVSPDQEERIRRKDTIIQTRNAQVAALWDELHTKQPWRNAVASSPGAKPIQPFPQEAVEETDAQQRGGKPRLVLFIGINSGLTSRNRRDILRRTWVPTGKLQDIESRLGVRIRFFVGYPHKRSDRVEQELQAEMREFGDIERLDVVDEYAELSRKTARLFAHMSDSVVADFYFKIDDDVAVNIEALAEYLRERRSQGNLYLGCMKSGEVLTDKRWKWYEPEHWRFGDPAGKDGKINYLRHASGQIYGMARPVARYIARNEAILHRYANEDVAVGAWLVGLDVQYDNQRRLCCDTEWKCTGQSSKDNVCLAFSENQCAGLCRAEERLEGIFNDCVKDPYGAGKKGKLPWWGSSGWATAARPGSTGTLSTLAQREAAKQAAQDAAAKGGAAGAAGAGAAGGGTAGGAAAQGGGTAQGAGAAAALGNGRGTALGAQN